MRASRWRFALPGIIVTVAVLAAVVWDLRRSGVIAYRWATPVSGALFALAIVNRPRLFFASLGGAGAGVSMVCELLRPELHGRYHHRGPVPAVH